MNILIVVDMQNDFCKPYGSLYSPAAERIIPAIKERIAIARENSEMVIFTQDTHMEDYLDTLEGEKLPVVHCIYGSKGHKIVNELKDEAALCVLKPTFASFDLINRINTIKQAMGEEPNFEVCGVLTSICVVSNCLTLRGAFPNSRIVVNPILCGDSNDDNAAAAFTVMKQCQIEVKDYNRRI